MCGKFTKNYFTGGQWISDMKLIILVLLDQFRAKIVTAGLCHGSTMKQSKALVLIGV